MSCSPPMCLVRAFLLKKTAVSKTRQSHPSSPSALPQAENTIEATATALNELGKGVAILGTTWECGPSAARAKNLVMSPHQRRDTKNTREREREKKINQIIYLSVYQRNKESIYLSICLSVCLSICLSKKSNASLWHRTQDMYGYVSNRMPTPTQTWASY